MNKFILLGSLSLLLNICFLSLTPIETFAAGKSEISSVAQQRFAVIDGLDVQNHWSAGIHVNWETGDPDGKPVSSEGKHTHCSAFAAAAAKSVGVYLLRPPEHGQIMLANAQQEWLLDDSKGHGWKKLANGIEAQTAANQGQLVLASYENPNEDKPGHIAIVRPSDKPVSLIETEGPQITQAGLENYQSTSIVVGFAGHPKAFAENQILYFTHDVP
jgi:hypothetical protein